LLISNTNFSVLTFINQNAIFVPEIKLKSGNSLSVLSLKCLHRHASLLTVAYLLQVTSVS